MTREELEFAAHQAICRWADTTKPLLPGRPSFRIVAVQPLENILISHKFLGCARAGFVYLFDAQEVLDTFDEVDRASLEVVMSL